ncbi:hypothetical protein BDY19DRAFT_994392 [Irpex rosettiformis]|uniref:Uncharacterized protein n=1 Tax=Irpex rosettiformis TaxID=378272 RepID=A0ACB8U1L4_9APHY|nr:hypothetical protein BDY19DRAFT_994392 [Irpex rosettiformis]
MPPTSTPTQHLQRDTSSIQSQATLNNPPSTQNSPRYVLPLIIGLSSSFVLLSLLLLVILKQRFRQNRTSNAVNRLNVDVSVDIYTAKSEGEVTDIALSPNNEKLLNSGSFSEFYLCMPSPATRPGDKVEVERSSYINASDFSLGEMLGLMDVDFFSRSTVRFPRFSCSEKPEHSSDVSPARCCQEGEDSPPSPIQELRSTIAATQPSTSFCLSEDRKPDVLDHTRPSGARKFSSSGELIPLSGLGPNVSSTIDGGRTAKSARLAVASKDCENPKCFILDEAVIPNDHLRASSATLDKRPISTASSLLPVIPISSPLILASLAPLRLDGTPTSLGSMDVGISWPDDSPILSVELNIDNVDGDDTLVSHDACSNLKLKSSLSSRVVLSTPSNYAPKVTPQICVQLASTPSQDSLSRLRVSTPSTNLLAQSAPALLPSAWYEPSTAIPPIRTIARVLQPLFEDMEDVSLSSTAPSASLDPSMNLEPRNSVSSLLSAFAFPLMDTLQSQPQCGPITTNLLNVNVAHSETKSSNGFLASGSFSSQPTYLSPYRRSRSRTFSTSRSNCLSLSPSIRQVSIRPSAPTPGSLLSRLSLQSPSPSLRSISTGLRSSDTPSVFLSGSPFRRPRAPTPGSVLSRASESLDTFNNELPSSPVLAPSLTPSSRRDSIRSRSFAGISPYSRPHAPTPGSVVSLCIS